MYEKKYLKSISDNFTKYQVWIFIVDGSCNISIHDTLILIYMTGMAPSLQARKAVRLQVLGVQAYRRAYTAWNFTSYQLPIIIRGAFLSRRGNIAR